VTVKPHDPAKGVPLKRVLAPIFATRFGAWTAIHVGSRVDPFLMRATKGRVRIAITAPTVLLRHTGRRSGTVFTTPLLYFTDANNVILVGSNGGSTRHTQWYRNLLAHPDVELSCDGAFDPYRAHEAEGEERARLWKLANELYPGYDTYQERAGNRRIPVLVLRPR